MKQNPVGPTLDWREVVRTFPERQAAYLRNPDLVTIWVGQFVGKKINIRLGDGSLATTCEFKGLEIKRPYLLLNRRDSIAVRGHSLLHIEIRAPGFEWTAYTFDMSKEQFLVPYCKPHTLN